MVIGAGEAARGRVALSPVRAMRSRGRPYFHGTQKEPPGLAGAADFIFLSSASSSGLLVPLFWSGPDGRSLGVGCRWPVGA